MRQLKRLLILALLAPVVGFAQPTSPVTSNGYNVNIYAPDAVGTSVPTSINLHVPRTDGTASLFTGGSERIKADGTGSVFVPTSNPAAAATPVAVGAAGTIDTTNVFQRVSTAGAVTGVILENGTANGQIVLVALDKDAAGTITFAAEATSNVCSGTSAVLAAGEGAMFVYDSTDTCWSELGT